MRIIYFFLLWMVSTFVYANNQFPLTANTGTNGKIDLSWSVTNPNYWYQIQKSYNGVDFYNIGNATPGTKNYTNSQLYYNLQYWYHIIAHNPDGSVAENSSIAIGASPSSLPDPYPVFQDSFDSINLNPSWHFLGGNWQQKAGQLEQIDTMVESDIKKAILTDQSYPLNQTILAKVRVTGWSGAPHVGVGILTDPSKGYAYELVFHKLNQVQFLNYGVAWGAAFNFPWKLKQWYWFKLSNQNNILFGKVWEDGTPEPKDWLFQQTGWTNRTSGYPSLDGGSKFQSSIASAVFDEVSIFATINQPMPFAIGGDESVNPADFAITTFASGLNYPHGMQELADHSILVATSDPVQNGNYFNSIGTLLRFKDENDDGIADSPPEIKYTGLTGTLTSLKIINNLVFVTSSSTNHESISILRMGVNPGDSYTLLNSIVFHFPSQWDHRTYALLVRPGINNGDYELFFNVGSEFNNAADVDMPTLSGLIASAIKGSSIYRVLIHDNGINITATNLTLIADGLRNAAGLSFDKINGDLYLADNGIDDPNYADEPLSVDTLQVIPKNKMGIEVLHFGFPNSYIKYRTNKPIGSNVVIPLAAFQPWTDPFTGEESEGSSEIEQAPQGFPSNLNNGIFVTFHGRFNLAGIQNEENPLVFYNKLTKKYFHFINVKEPNIGHIDDLLATQNALFLADLCKTGNPMSQAGSGAGVIYKIRKK